MHSFDMCNGFPVPHNCRFRSALFSSRTVGFPESGWRRQLFSPRNLSIPSEVQALACIRLLTTWLYPRLDILQNSILLGSAPDNAFLPMPTAHREPLYTITALPRSP